MIGSYNLRQVKASASGPLVENILYGGVGLIYKKRDGIQTNQYDGEKLWDADSQGVRGNLKMTPTDSVTLKLGVDYSRDNSMPRVPHLVAADQAVINGVYGYAQMMGGLLPSAPPPDFSNISASPDKVNSEADYSPYRLNTLTAYFSAEWSINDFWSFKSVSAERRVDQTFIGEFDGSALTYLSNTQYAYSDDLSQEFQLNYSGDDLDSVLGFYYTNGRQETPSFGTISPYVFVTATRVTDTYKATNVLNSWAVYGNADYSITDAWHASAGLRFTRDRKTFEQLSNVAYYDIGGNTAGAAPDNFGPESKTWSNLSPSLKLAYDFDENTMGYVSFATGFKAGGYNSYPNGSPSKTYNPEKVKTYALGLKTTLADGRLRLNTEAFYNDYTDKQLQYLANVSGNITTLYTNAGKVNTRGIETEISWLTPVDGLQFDLNIGYLDAQIDKFDRFGIGDVASHSELGFSPQWTVQPRVSYDMAVGDLGDVMLAADASYRSRSYTNSPVDIADATDRQQVQSENIIYNANIALTTADDHWRFALEGRNLSNRRVLTNTFNLNLGLDPSHTSTFVLGSYNDPRTWALSARYKF
jgi:iron complex outermembrane receptor protein